MGYEAKGSGLLLSTNVVVYFVSVLLFHARILIRKEQFKC